MFVKTCCESVGTTGLLAIGPLGLLLLELEILFIYASVELYLINTFVCALLSVWYRRKNLLTLAISTSTLDESEHIQILPCLLLEYCNYYPLFR